MASVEVVNSSNEKSGSLDLDPRVFEAGVRPDLFHAEVRRQLALRHRGTHSSKNRSRVAGGGAKPYRQKGTGRARQGTTRAPQFAGGGSVFGPVPRSHAHGSLKKVRRAALCSVISHRLAEGSLVVIEALEANEGKTREVAGLIRRLGFDQVSVLFVIEEANESFERATKNLARADVIRASGLNVYDVLRHSKLVLTKDAVAAVESRLGVVKPAGAKS